MTDTSNMKNSEVSDYDSIEEIGVGFFNGSEKIVLPKSLKTIGDNIFLRCTNLKEIVIPEGVEKIGDQAFAYCRHLRKIFIPASVKELANPDQNGTFFNSCLEEIIVDENNPYFKSVDGVLLSKDGKKLIHYPCRKKGDTYTIPEGVEEVDSLAFFHYMSEDYIKEVFIPETVHLKNKDFMKCIENSGEETRDEWYDGYIFIKSGEAIDVARTLPIIEEYLRKVKEGDDLWKDDLDYIDLKELFNNIKEKADAGDKEACLDLSWLYQKGFGTEINIDESIRYYNLAN